MRIRKHARISPVVYATSYPKPAALPPTLSCQLNQSPWDVIQFSPPSPTPPPPPPPSQVDGDGVSDGDGSSGRRVSVTQREAVEIETKAAAATLCCKTDGKSWRCRSEAAEGSSLCEHHVSQAKSYSRWSHYESKKLPRKVAARRVQAKKVSSSSSPYEFYYYSGFGPRWGKKRGENTNNNGVGGDNMIKKSVDNEIEREAVASKNNSDEEEGNGVNNAKKRVRKPIKARSLKSLICD